MARRHREFAGTLDKRHTQGAPVRLGPSTSTTTSTTERALPSSAVQARCWSRPTTTTRLPHDHDPAAPRQRLGRVLGLVAPRDHGEERRLLLPPTRHRHPEHRSGDATFGGADLGLVGEVAGEAHGCPRSCRIPPRAANTMMGWIAARSSRWRGEPRWAWALAFGTAGSPGIVVVSGAVWIDSMTLVASQARRHSSGSVGRSTGSVCQPRLAEGCCGGNRLVDDRAR
jgi:hypothetical protein